MFCSNSREGEKGWSHENVLQEQDEENKEREFYDMKNAVEQIMEYKIVQRRQVQAAFGWDVAQLIFYGCFLILFSVNNVYNPYTYQLFSVNQVIADSFAGSTYPLTGVKSIPDIYNYLEYTVVPNVAAQNVSLLDARCMPDGRHVNPVCLEKPFANEELCCYTKQPNKGIFAPGSHTKNLLVTPITIRQQRVRAILATTPLSGQFRRWPALDGKSEETRDGGGTVLDHDPDGDLIDWPPTAKWYKYKICSGPHCRIDSKLGNKLVRTFPRYSMSGYVALLNGTAQSMIQELSRLNKYEFLGGSTRGVFVDFTAFFPGEELFATVSILFEISPTDVLVVPSISTRVSDLRQSSGGWIIVDYFVFGYAASLLLIDLFKLVRAPHECVRSFFSSIWPAVSWMNYGIFTMCFIKLFQLDQDTAGIKGIVPVSEQASAYPWTDRTMRIDEFRAWSGMNCLLSWLRLIRYLEQMSPSTQQLTGTISASLGDLSVFVFMLMIVLFGFLQAFMLQFGSQVSAYSGFSIALLSLFRTLLGDFHYDDLDRIDPLAAKCYFMSFIILVVFMMFNMVIAIVMKTYDTVAAELALKARTEVTGVSILQQNLQSLFRLLSARTLDDLKKVSPDDDGGMNMSSMYGQEKAVFELDYLTENEFRALFASDDEALHRMGVRSVEELVMYADVTGKPRLDMKEVHEYREKLDLIAGKKREDNVVAFAPLQLAQMRSTMEGSMETALDDSVRALKTYIHNQISQATLVLSGAAMGEAIPGAGPKSAGKGGGGGAVRSSPMLPSGVKVDMGL